MSVQADFWLWFYASERLVNLAWLTDTKIVLCVYHTDKSDGTQKAVCCSRPRALFETHILPCGLKPLT